MTSGGHANVDDQINTPDGAKCFGSEGVCYGWLEAIV